MISLIDVMVELGRRMRSFGKEGVGEGVIARAVEANEWFSRADILRAVDAICEEFLVEEKLREWIADYPTLGINSSPQPTPQPSHQPTPQPTPQTLSHASADAPGLTKRPRVAIIMAGNIPLVGFFDMLCVLLCGCSVAVKPSSKDRLLMEYVISLLRDIEPQIAIEEYTPDMQVDMVIATGGDDAAAHFRSKYSSIPSLIRGSRHSVAVLGGEESEQQMEGLQSDIFTYNGLGCRSVSLVFLPRGAMLELKPPKVMVEMYRGSYLANKALLAMRSVEFLDFGSAVALESTSFPDALSEIHYHYYDDIAEVEQWLTGHDEVLQCVVSETVSHPRRVDFGRAQYPTLRDYADGVDVMEFIINNIR